MKRFNEKRAFELIESFCMSHKLEHGTTLYKPSGLILNTDKVLSPYINFDKFMTGLKDYYDMFWDCSPASIKYWNRNYRIFVSYHYEIGSCYIGEDYYTLNTGSIGNTKSERFNY